MTDLAPGEALRADLITIGIDPALTATGLVVLGYKPRWVETSNDSPNHWLIAQHTTVKTKADEPLDLRAGWLALETARIVAGWLSVYQRCAAIVVENPCDQVARAGRGKRQQRRDPQTIALMGLGVGAVLAGLRLMPKLFNIPLQAGRDGGLPHPVLIDTNTWLPKTRTGNFTHPMRHEHAVNWIVNRLELPDLSTAPYSDHELMAAGVAQWWIEREREEQRRAERGMPSLESYRPRPKPKRKR